jgi:hypothetical protein
MIYIEGRKGNESNKTRPIPEPTYVKTEDGYGMLLRNGGIPPQDYTVP